MLLAPRRAPRKAKPEVKRIWDETPRQDDPLAPAMCTKAVGRRSTREKTDQELESAPFYAQSESRSGYVEAQ
jgi:hypothetical protein